MEGILLAIRFRCRLNCDLSANRLIRCEGSKECVLSVGTIDSVWHGLVLMLAADREVPEACSTICRQAAASSLERLINRWWIVGFPF